MTRTDSAGAPPRAIAIEDTALWKALVLSEANRYTGSLRVGDGARDGTIFFDGGRLVHCVCGDRRGEPALKTMMLWPECTYTLAEQGADAVTITRRLAVVLSELRGDRAAPDRAVPDRPAPRAPPSPGAWIAGATERIRALPGVLGAALESGDATAAGLGPRTPEETSALALLPAARRLAGALGLGRPVLAVARGAERLVLLVVLREHGLAVLVRDEDQANAVRSQLRALLNPSP